MSNFVQDSDLDARRTSCIFCGSSSFGRRCPLIQTSPPVRVLKCSTCKARYVDRLPKRHFLDGLYVEADYAGFLDASVGLSESLANRLSKAISTSGFDQRSVRILDYGGGSGTLGVALAKRLECRGWDCHVTVVDIVTQGAEDGILFLTPEKFDDEISTFDVILCSAVVEHLRDPGSRLNLLFSRLHEGGWLYVRSPQLGGLLTLKKSWWRWPRHLSDLGPSFWRRFPNLSGWGIDVIWSRASRPETEWRSKPLSTLASNLLKLPCTLEDLLRDTTHLGRECRYPWVGGWEFLGRKQVTAERSAAGVA